MAMESTIANYRKELHTRKMARLKKTSVKNLLPSGQITHRLEGKYTVARSNPVPGTDAEFFWQDFECPAGTRLNGTETKIFDLASKVGAQISESMVLVRVVYAACLTNNHNELPSHVKPYVSVEVLSELSEQVTMEGYCKLEAQTLEVQEVINNHLATIMDVSTVSKFNRNTSDFGAKMKALESIVKTLGDFYAVLNSEYPVFSSRLTFLNHLVQDLSGSHNALRACLAYFCSMGTELDARPLRDILEEAIPSDLPKESTQLGCLLFLAMSTNPHTAHSLFIKGKLGGKGLQGVMPRRFINEEDLIAQAKEQQEIAKMEAERARTRRQEKLHQQKLEAIELKAQKAIEKALARR